MAKANGKEVHDEGQIEIIVIEGGQIVVGNLTVESGGVCVLNAFSFRSPMSQRKLGLVAAGGPDKDVAFDSIGALRIPYIKIVSMIRCNQSKWWHFFEVAHKHEEYPIEIVIGESGWVFVGRVSQEGDYAKITGCSVIRVWGTTKGLGEIALAGPTTETKLDKCGSVRIFRNKIVATMNCIQEHWVHHVD